jgi:hypothetical protein
MPVSEIGLPLGPIRVVNQGASTSLGGIALKLPANRRLVTAHCLSYFLKGFSGLHKAFNYIPLLLA